MNNVSEISDIEVKEVSVGCGARLASKSTCNLPNLDASNDLVNTDVGLTRSLSLPLPKAVSYKEKVGDEEVKEEEEVKDSSHPKSPGRIVTKYIAPLTPAKWKSKLACNRQDEVWGYWYQPDTAGMNVRSKTYLSTSLKVANGAPPLLELVNFDFFSIENRVDDVGSHKNSWLNRACPAELKNRKFLIINIQIAAISVLLVQYFVFNEKGSTGCERVDKMWEEFVSAPDEVRDSRLKLIPTIVDGPWLVRNFVPTRPCIIGKKVRNRYSHGANYFEVDIETDASLAAKSILSILQGYSNYSVNLTWLLEAVKPEELPERILAAAHLGNPEYKKAISLENIWK